ncbi:MAG TPA: hypothetical protein VJ623_15970 [Holophagaceae bacterium]|nr:hypothetical protein [Holophagaceae bacterium]
MLLLPPAPPALEAPAPARPNLLKAAKGQRVDVVFSPGTSVGSVPTLKLLAAFADKEAPAFQQVQLTSVSAEAAGAAAGAFLGAEKAVDAVLEPGTAYAVVVETATSPAWERMRGALEGRYKVVARFQADTAQGTLGLRRFTLLKVGPAEGLDAANWGRFLPVPDGGFVALAVVPKP